MVTVIAVSTCLFNSFVLGLIFAKFSSASRRRWTVSFSSSLVSSSPKPFKSTLLPLEPLRKDPIPFVSDRNQSDDPIIKQRFTQKKLTREELSNNRATMVYHAKVPCVPLTSPPQTNMISSGSKGLNSTKLESYMIDGTRPISAFDSSDENDDIHFTLSFRMMNLSNQSFFDTHLSLFLLVRWVTIYICNLINLIPLCIQYITVQCFHFLFLFQTHGDSHIEVSRITLYYSDLPLEFIEFPITVSIDTRDLFSSIREFNIGTFLEYGSMFELLVR